MCEVQKATLAGDLGITFLCLLLGAICMMWAYWAFNRYDDESDKKNLNHNQGNE